MVLTAVLVGLIGVGHAIWLWTHRLPGVLNIDEAAYSTVALRFRGDLFNPTIIRDLLTNGSAAPLVPFLSAVVMLVAPTDPRSVMLVQPILLTVAATAVTGICRRFSGSFTAVAAGVAFALWPTTVAAARSYWFGLGVSAFLCLAVLGLLRSQRGTSRWIWVYGLCIGLTPLARTMAISFLPGLLLAAALLTWPDRRGRRRAAIAFAGGVAVAAPVFIAERRDIFGYLLDSGYGDTEQRLFADSPWERPWTRFAEIRADLGGPMAWVVLGLVVVGVLSWLARGGRPWPVFGRELIAAVVVLSVGLAALLSTANNGDLGFQLPMVALGTALGAAACARVPFRLGAVAVAPVLLVGMATLGNGWWLLRPDNPLITAFVSDLHRRTIPEGMTGNDPRLAPERRDEELAAIREWWTVLRRLDDRLRSLDDPPGSLQFDIRPPGNLVTGNELDLLEVTNGPPRLVALPIDDRRYRCDRPVDDGIRRVIVIPEGDSPDPMRAEAPEIAARLAANCWHVVDRIPMPAYGDLVLWAAPGSPGLGGPSGS